MEICDGVGEVIYATPIVQFNPLRLPAAATSPEFCSASLWGGGGWVGVLREITFKDEFANSTIRCLSCGGAARDQPVRRPAATYVRNIGIPSTWRILGR